MASSKRYTNRGMAIKSVIMMGVVGALLLSVMSLLGFTDFFVSFDSRREFEAELVGRSVVNMARDRLQQGDIALNERLEYTPTKAEFAGTNNNPTAYLHFDQEQPYYSTNNLSSGSPVQGWGGTLVPKRSIHLLGVAQAGELTVVEEVIVGLPNFPFSIAANGTVEGTELEIFGLDSLEALDGGVTEEEKKNSNIISNHETGVAITLDTVSSVHGDVEAAGQIDASPSQVTGKISPDSDPNPFNPLDLTLYDPLAGGVPFTPYTSAITNITEGKARHDGALTLSNTLTLEKGVLFVDGDLTIAGRVEGSGAIIATGDITVTGQLNLESDFVALVSGGDVLIQGQGQEDLGSPSAGGTRMQGLVYANGSFTASDATVVGAVLSSEINGSTSLDRVNMAFTPEATNFEIVVDYELATVVQDGPAERDGYTVAVELPGGAVTPFDELHESDLRSLAGVLAEQPDDQRGAVKLFNADGTEATNAPLAASRAHATKTRAWTDYVTAVEENTLTTETIFAIDLNSFLSLESNLRVLSWKSQRKPKDD